MAKAIKMGCEARDVLTGFTGIVTQKVEQLSGNIQYTLQPQVKPGEQAIPDAMSIDFHTVEWVGEGQSALAVPVLDRVAIRVGEKVRDQASDFEGIAISKVTCLNGCTYFTVVPKIIPGALINEAPGGSFLDHKRLVKVDNGLKGIVVPGEKSEVTGRRPGGPMAKAPRI